MVALFDDVAVLHNQDDIRIADGGKAMGNNETCSALHQLVKGSLDFHFGSCIDGRSSFIQYQHRRIIQHDSGNAQ